MIEIAIDEIVLDVPVADVAAFGRSVEACLAALAAGHTARLPAGEAPLLLGAPVEAGPGASPDALGAAVAGSVWRAIAPSPQGTPIEPRGRIPSTEEGR